MLAAVIRIFPGRPTSGEASPVTESDEPAAPIATVRPGATVAGGASGPCSPSGSTLIVPLQVKLAVL